MKVINKKMCVVIILILLIIESYALFLTYKSYRNKKSILDEFNQQENLNSKMYAIMLEQEDGTYKEDNSNNWPTSGYTYNESMSGCIDINGNEIESSLSYNTNTKKILIRAKEASSCYLYFSIKPKAAEYLLENPSLGLNVVLEAGMYRYQGTDDVDNYMCFGTNDKNECINDTNSYMYRIIGIRPNGQIKLIKKEALNGTLNWWNSSEDNIEWPNSIIKSAINGARFLTNKTYVPTGWESKIATTKWKYGDVTNSGSFIGATIYDVENPFGESTAANRFTKEVSAKIGIWYIHDYYYAYASGGAPGSYSVAKTAWIHLSKNDSSVSNLNEMFMVRYSHNAMWIVYSSGNTSHPNYNGFYSVRPVFYLTSDVEITGGTGAIDDPYIIS